MIVFLNNLVHPRHKLPFWRILLVGIIISSMLPACATPVPHADSSSSFSGWRISELRLLQAPGSDPEHSLVAVYDRKTTFDLEIRLDFLDLAGSPDFDVYLALDTQPGGSNVLPIDAKSGLNFDVLVKIPATGIPQAFNLRLQPMSGLLPRSANHPGLDILTIQLNRSSIPGNASAVGLQAFITPAGGGEILSQTPPLSPTTYKPVQAPLLLIFWDTLPAATPAQILRRWDGAHTGPYGGRHGLNVLLTSAASNKVPLVLADLEQPSSFTALSMVGGLEQVRQSARRGDLILAESAVGDPLLSSQSLDASRQSASENRFPTSLFAFGNITDPMVEPYTSFFADLPDRSHIISWQSKRLIPLPGPVFSASPTNSDPQVDYEGLTLASRIALLSAALSPDMGDLVVLGGSLPESAWGEFSIAPAAFAYIAAHPWIYPLDQNSLDELAAVPAADFPMNKDCRDLLCSPAPENVIPVSEAGIPIGSELTAEFIRSDLRSQLKSLKSGPFTQLALQSYLSLTQPTRDQALSGLQANALGYVSYLLEAARWEEKPYTRTDCSLDLDFDFEPECILASNTWFVILKTAGGRLIFAAHRTQTGAVQWIGSPVQFGVGLGDPSEWKPELGPLGNPVEIPGAFVFANDPFAKTIPEIQPGNIILKTVDDAIQKAFTLVDDRLEVEILSAQPFTTRIPVTLAPQDWASGRSLAAWLPVPFDEPDRWEWRPESESGMTIRLENAHSMSAVSSLDSVQQLSRGENPNLAYPPGHYLTFPLAVITIQGQDIRITFIPQ